MVGISCLYQLNHWLSLCHWVAWITSVKGRKMSVWKVRWVKNITQSGSKVDFEFDDFLGTSLKGLEEQATDFLLVVEVELYQRVAKEKNQWKLKSLGVKGIRELRGLFSSIMVQYQQGIVVIVGVGLCLFLNEFEVAIAYLEG